MLHAILDIPVAQLAARLASSHLVVHEEHLDRPSPGECLLLFREEPVTN
jgi:hypothetical protein